MGATALAQERLFALRKAIAKIEGRPPGDALGSEVEIAADPAGQGTAAARGFSPMPAAAGLESLLPEGFPQGVMIELRGTRLRDAGAVSGFALVLRMMTGPGDRVVVDHPTYPLAIAAIQGAQCRPVGVSLPETGWDTDGFAATLAQTAPRLAYLMPDFHNPTGRCMDIATRQAITDIAAQTRTALVVDETMVDLWFDAPPPPPLAAFNLQATVITLGSAGKSFWGGLRLGWIRASSRIIATLAQTRDTLDLGSPLLEQLAMQWLINNSETFLPARRKMLAERRDRCGDLLREHFPEWKFHEAEGGLSYWIELPGMLATQLAARAEIIGINLGTGTRFGLSGAFDRYLRMPFSLESTELEQALLRIKPLWLALNKNVPSLKRSVI